MAGKLKNKYLQSALVLSHLFFVVPTTLVAQGTDSVPRPKVNTKPIELDWQSIQWPALSYGRVPLNAGGGLYTLSATDTKKVKIDLSLPFGVFSQPEEDRVLLEATSDLLLLGGSAKRNFDELQKTLNDNGIDFGTTVSGYGNVLLSVSGMASDTTLILSLLQEILLTPKFEPNALALWKQNRNDSFKSILDASNTQKQGEFSTWITSQFIYGENHYFSKNFERKSAKWTNGVSLEKVKANYKKLLNGKGLRSLISGNFSMQTQEKLVGILNKIPASTPPVYEWLPPRVTPKNSTESDINVLIITKKDMPQANVSYRLVFPKAGKFNPIERVQFYLLNDVFSATGGVIGNDRFSKALRADSGISYSPRAQFQAEVMEPNPGVAAWRMNYQASTERLVESVSLAHKTWKEFSEKGITQEELDTVRISKANQEMSSETTVFDKAAELWSAIIENRVPNSTPQESLLRFLSLQKSAEQINKHLSEFITTNNAIPVLTVIGSVTAEQIAELGKLDFVKIRKTVSFEDLLKETESWK